VGGVATDSATENYRHFKW